MQLKRMPQLYLDLDGVFADFDAHFPATFNEDLQECETDRIWSLISEHGSFFRTMPMCVGGLEFFESVKKFDPIILTACPKTNYQHVALQKKAWVKEFLDPDIMVLPVMGGRNKFLFMHRVGDILIDDFEKNCIPWGDAGGVFIKHENFEKTRLQLMVFHPLYNDN